MAKEKDRDRDLENEEVLQADIARREAAGVPYKIAVALANRQLKAVKTKKGGK